MLCRDSVASTTANTSLTADNIIDTYAGADRTLNATSASIAAFAILACKVSIGLGRNSTSSLAARLQQECITATVQLPHTCVEKYVACQCCCLLYHLPSPQLMQCLVWAACRCCYTCNASMPLQRMQLPITVNQENMHCLLCHFWHIRQKHCLMLIAQADSNCQLSATGSSTAADADADSVTASSDDIAWLKWTGAAVLFVEALIVSHNLLVHTALLHHG